MSHSEVTNVIELIKIELKNSKTVFRFIWLELALTLNLSGKGHAGQIPVMVQI